MDRCGLNSSDFAAYVAHLRSPSIGVETHAQLLAMDGTVLESMGQVTGGQLNVDTSDLTRPTRTATLILSDPGHTMSWDSNSPASSAASVDRMIRVQHVTYVPALGYRVRCNLITGPIRGWSRTGTDVTMTINGRDDLMLGQAWRTRTYRKGEYKTTALRDLFQFYGGVMASGIPSLPARLPSNVSLGRTSVPMATARSIADSLNRHVLFDGTGLPALRPHATTPVLTLWQGDRDGHRSDIIGDTQATYALASGWFNVAQVTGATPKIQAVAYPPLTDALHPKNMNSGGAWTVQLYTETNTKLRSVAEAQARANQLIRQQLLQTAQVTAISKVFPFLEEDDFVRIATQHGNLDMVLSKYSIDFAGTGMSLGWNKRFTSNRIARPSRRLAR